ncbi:MAG: hypothetical protein FJ386_09680 [Verrucomicrobia bacterium]|nr:hypothetical protein [Verrucomicrobiota bacterium]
MARSCFPAGLRDMPGNITFEQLKPGSFHIGRAGWGHSCVEDSVALAVEAAREGLDVVLQPAKH